MDWSAELQRFALHAVLAAAVVAAVRWGPGRSWLDAGVRRVAGMPAGRFLLLAVLLTAVVRSVLLLAFQPALIMDVREYVEKAAVIAETGSPRVHELGPGPLNYRCLGYPLALGGWFALTGTKSLLSARILNVLIACGTTWLLLLLGRAARRETAGRVAALLHATSLPLAVFAVIPYAETFAALLVCGMVLCHERLRGAEARGAAPWLLAAGAGLLAGLLVITRTEFLWVPAVLPVLLLWERRRELTRLLGPALLVPVAAALPFLVNHEMRDGYPGHLRTSTNGGLILYFGNNPIDVNGYANATPEVAAEVSRLYVADPTGGAARTAALDWMAENPGAVAANVPKKLYHLWIGQPVGFDWYARAGLPGGLHGGTAWVLRHLAWIQELVLLGLGAAALVLIAPRPRLTWLLLLGHGGVWALLATYSRFRYPLEPLVLLAVGVWFVERKR